MLALRAKSAAGLWRGGTAHSLEFSNCARTAMTIVLDPWNNELLGLYERVGAWNEVMYGK